MKISNKALRRRLDVKDYIFDIKNPNFEPNSDHNLFFISRTENYFNDLLAARGYVFLNEVLSHLGIRPRMIGQLAGWRKDAGGLIHIKITQTRYLGIDVQEYFLEIEHDGLIVDVLGD